ncbi:MAG TPA: hypothetical protein DCR95_12940, partial [Desulfobacter sp.]|nr:hypothetical protein [Desulfobacter sp.]
MMSYALSLYASPAHNWFGSYLPDLRWSLLASLCTLISIFVNKSHLVPKTPWLSTAPAKIIICYAIWMWIQLLWALSYEAHIEGTILITKYIILYYIIYRVLDNDSTFFTFIMFNLVGGFYISRRVLGYSMGGRVEGIGGPGINDSNTLGMHMSVLLIFAGMMLLKKNTLFRNNLHWRICQGIILISAVYIANSVVQTISRSAVLGILSGGALLMVIKHWTVKKRFYLYA